MHLQRRTLLRGATALCATGLIATRGVRAAMPRASFIDTHIHYPQTQMVAALSHELRTPIHSLLGCLEVAQEAPDLTEHTRGLLRTMTRCAQHLQSLAGDLTLAYVPDERMEPETHSICVDTLVQSALELTRAATKSHHVELDLQCPGQLCSADPRQIAQVLVNLMSNACKHTPSEGRIRIEIGRAHV